MDISHIETIPFYENISAELLSGQKAGALKNGLHTIVPNPQKGKYIIRTEQGAAEFDFQNKQDKANIDLQFCRGTAHICNVKSMMDDGSFLFDLYSFAGAAEDFGDIEILAEEENLSNLLNKDKAQSAENLRKNLAKACSIELDGETYFIMQGDYGQKKDDNEEENTPDEDAQEKAPAGMAFSILCDWYGKCHAIKVQQKKLSPAGKDEYFAVTGTFPRRNIQTAGNFHLVRANLVFSDQKKAASEYNLAKLKAITEKSGSYLKAWREYTGARGNRILAQARMFGEQHYNSCIPTSNDSVKLYFEKSFSDKVPASSFEEIVLCKNGDPLPLFLEDKKCSFLDYCAKKKEREAERRKNKLPREDEICCKVRDIGENCIEIELPGWKDAPSASDVAQKGYVVMSMKGEESQIERQQVAWEAIAQGRAGISSLGNILEGSFDFMPPGSTPPKMHIPNRVREKIFRNPPTDRQLEAIELALRTPDIALVQGPPGTGKTTVITAVLELLNEAQDKRGASAGRVLATSYQHDAVENMIERITVNALPTWKYGKRRNGSPEDYNKHIDSWCKKIEDRVLAMNPDIHVSQEEETFHSYVAEYVSSPVSENRARLLEYIGQLPVTEEIAGLARKLLLKDGQAADSYCPSDMLRKIRALRTNEKSFSDDGAKRTEELFFALEESWLPGHEDAEKLLMDLAMCKAPAPDQLVKLARLKEELLEEFTPRPSYVSSEIDDDVIALCKETANFLEARHGKKDKKEQIIADWIQTLQGGQEVFSRAIKDCDFVYAATSQQSVGKDIKAQKTAVEGAMSPYIYLYDTVIIDEAARAAPPDLLIPMCNAVKRIILVGDHRQLPQLVDDDLCNDVYAKVQEELRAEGNETAGNSEDIGESYETAFKLSLFELLFKKLKDLEKKDGIKRTITLDKQFRTHPVLGKFCSDLFYKEEGGYDSPRPAGDFAHNLPGIENKAAVWIDVPKECGKEEKRGTSRIRECEADCIVERFLAFVRSQKDIPKEKKLSYGIIAFYSAQRDLIAKKIEPHKKELKDVTYRVGTVDAFQGMEFDVVFLSVVRSGGSINFLTPNRLCVSMSRQKKVLIAVGCKAFVTSKEARSQKVPALSGFYDLCAGKNDEGYGAVLTWKK